MDTTNLADIVRRQGKDQPQRVALIAGDSRLTYGALDRRSSQVAAGLRALGVATGDRVAFLDKNGPEYFEVLFGVAKLNAVLCAVNWRLAAPEAAFVVADSEAEVLVIGREFAPLWTAIASSTPGVRHVLVVGGEPSDDLPAYEGWRDAQVPSDPGLGGGPDDVALQFYSSGTTGRPKGVMLTNANCFASIASSQASLGFVESSVSLVAMPLFHVAGGAWGVFGLHYGVANVVLREVDPALVVRSIGEHGITHAVLVPAVIQAILALPDLDPHSFDSLEVLIYGASPISEDVLTRAIRMFGCRFFQAYGMTETTGGCVLLPPEDHDPDGPHRGRLRAAGLPAPGAEIKVVDPGSGEECRPGVAGEVLLRSRQNMKGYWKLPEETATTLLPDGWLRTGDVGYLDEDGYLYIHDRLKDMIISGGENIYPAEVENALMSCPGVADVAVIGVPDDRWGETPKALVVRSAAPQPPPDETTIIAYCRERLAHYKCPTSVDFVDALPRNPSGKVLKRELREPYWTDRERRVH